MKRGKKYLTPIIGSIALLLVLLGLYLANKQVEETQNRAALERQRQKEQTSQIKEAPRESSEAAKPTLP